MRLATAACILALAGCALGNSRRPSAAAAPNPPLWQDALDPHPDLLIALHPKALRDDRLYGPLLRRVLALARAHSRAVSGTRVLEAIEDAEEVVASLHAVGPDASDAADIVAVIRGVRADIDPGRLVDPDGTPLWSPGPNGRVRELVHERDENGDVNPASLFELPGRTWLIASGPSRERARNAFARPEGRAPPDLDPNALAEVVIDGPALAERVPLLRVGGGLSAVGRSLSELELELRPGVTREVRALLRYADDRSAEAAEQALSDLKDAIIRKKPDALAWLGQMTVDREPPPSTPRGQSPTPPARRSGGTTIVLSAAIPSEFIATWLPQPKPSVGGVPTRESGAGRPSP